MTSEEFKLKLVENTMKNCFEFAKECEEKSKKWEKANYVDLQEYFEGQASAFKMVAEFLKADLETEVK